MGTPRWIFAYSWRRAYWESKNAARVLRAATENLISAGFLCVLLPKRRFPCSLRRKWNRDVVKVIDYVLWHREITEWKMSNTHPSECRSVTSLANRKQLQVSASGSFMKAQTFVIAHNSSCFACWSRCNPGERLAEESLTPGYGSVRIETIYLDVRNREEARPRMHHISGHNCAIYFIIITTPASTVVTTKCFCAGAYNNRQHT